MMGVKVLTISAVAGLALGLGAAAAAPAPQHLITAHAIAGIPLGLTRTQYIRLLGKPVFATRFREGRVRLDFPERKLDVYLNARGIGVGILAADREFRTRSEVGPCSTLKQVRAAYGKRLTAVGPALPGRVAAYRVGQLVFAVTQVRTVGTVLLRTPTFPVFIALNVGQCGAGEGEGG